MNKDAWFEEYERLLYDFEDAHGREPNPEGRERIDRLAWVDAVNRQADMADQLLDAWKERQ